MRNSHAATLNRGRFASPLMAALVLGGCVADQPSTGSPDIAALSEQISKDNVRPGDEQADVTVAAMIFSNVCVDTAPSFHKASATLSSMPFRQHSGTGTYYHRDLDLSVKLLPGRCSMVFSSREEPLQLAIGLSAFAGSAGNDNSMGIDADSGAARTTSKGGTLFEFDPMGRSNGRNWYRAVLIAP